MTVVLDASAACELLLGGTGAETAAAALQRHRFAASAPHVLDLEVLSVLRQKVQRGEMDAQRAASALDDLAALGVDRYPHDAFAGRIWELRENFTPYDAAYVALAEALEGSELVTADGRLARAVREHTTIAVSTARNG